MKINVKLIVILLVFAGTSWASQGNGKGKGKSGKGQGQNTGGNPPNGTNGSGGIRRAVVNPQSYERTAIGSGGWFYHRETGKIVVNCTHTDTRGEYWASY